jgi:hypothetical protein
MKGKNMDLETRLGKLTISDSGLVFDPMTGTISTSNPVGVTILQALQRGSDIADVKKKVMLEYDAKDETVEKDIIDFISQMQHCGLAR